MSEERLSRLEASIRRISKEVVLQGERLVRLETGASKLNKLGELDERVTAFAEDIEAARRDRTLRDANFNENRETLLDHEARLLKIEREENDDTR